MKTTSGATITRIALFFFLFALPTTVIGDDDMPSNQQVLAWFKELKPLQKVHYSFPIPFKEVSDDLLFECARLTNAVSLSGEYGTPDQVERAVLICKQVNANRPKIPASIAINYSVWHRHFGKDLPPTDTGPTHQLELEKLKARMDFMRDALASANRKHDSDISLTAVLFDSEHFYTRADDAEWNKAMTTKYDAAYDTVQQVFPNVRIEWYARGAINPGGSATGWGGASYFTLKEKGGSFGCSLYQVPEIGYTREMFRRTVKNAEEHGCQEVTPWISLASGYRRQTDKYHEYSLDWNYDLIYSWQLGVEINQPWWGAPERRERFAPWNAAKIAIFYPAPFDPRVPHWAQHFVAYVRGANLVKSLPELPDTQSENSE
jgi:hypothetical protein